MTGTRFLIALLVVLAGCRLEPSPQAPRPGEPEAPRSEVHSSPAAPVAPLAPRAPTPSDPSPATRPPQEQAGLVVTIGGESFRLDTEAVRAVETTDDPYRGLAIVLVLREEAAESFARMTGANLGKQAVVTLDGRVLSSLSIQDRISGGRLPIPVEPDEIRALESQIRAATGTLPTV